MNVTSLGKNTKYQILYLSEMTLEKLYINYLRVSQNNMLYLKIIIPCSNLKNNYSKLSKGNFGTF